MLVVTLDSLPGRFGESSRAMMTFSRQPVYDVLMAATTIITLYTGIDYTVKYYSMMKNLLR
jgi:hypothetical protein